MEPARESLRRLSLVVVLAGCVLFAMRGIRDQRMTLQSFDFKPVYSGARCLLDGCDPYDSLAIEREFLAHGGPANDLRPFRPFNANYPPSALALVAPFALLPFGPAHLLWLGLSAALFSVAALLVADVCLELFSISPGGSAGALVAISLLLAVFVATSTMLLMLLQPAGVALGLLGIGVWCLLRGRFTAVGVTCFALSLTLKPHLGALVWLFFLLARAGGPGPEEPGPARFYRRRALQIAAAAIVFSLPGMVWARAQPASAHWTAELRRNLDGIAAHGNASDPGPANDEAHDITDLQAAFSVLRDEPRFYNTASWGACGVLFLLWALPVVRFPASRRRDLLGIAAAAGLTLLPLYHRQYDTRLLLLTFPATALLLATRDRLGYQGLLLLVLGTLVTTHNFPRWMERLYTGPAGATATLVCFRPMPLFLLILTCFYVVCLYRGPELEPF